MEQFEHFVDQLVIEEALAAELGRQYDLLPDFINLEVTRFVWQLYFTIHLHDHAVLDTDCLAHKWNVNFDELLEYFGHHGYAVFMTCCPNDGNLEQVGEEASLRDL